jgi:hypothetical protein
LDRGTGREDQPPRSHPQAGRAWAEGEEMSAAEASAYLLMAGGRRTEMFSVQSVL